MSEENEDLAGTCKLLSNARAAKEQLTALEGQGFTEEARVTEAQAKLDALRAKQPAAADAVKARKDQHAALSLRAEQLAGDLARAEAGPQLHRDLDAIKAERQEVDRKLDADLTDTREAAATAERQAKESEAGLEADLDMARTRIEEAASAQGVAVGVYEKALDDAEKVRQESAALDPDAVASRLTQATKDREAAERALREADQAVTRLTTQVDALRMKEASLAPIRERIRGLETDLSDWRLLAEATGKDGIPQLRIDAAGPEVSSTATEILRAVWGARFALEIRTQGETLKGKATEEFSIVVHDGAEQREVGDLCGGERVVTHFAISLACSIYMRKRSGIRWETLLLDEPGAALDLKHSRQFVPMLRRAMEIGGLVNVVFVSHNPEMIAGADVVVYVDEGVLSVGERRAAA